MRRFGGRESDNVEYGSGGGFSGKQVGCGIDALVIAATSYFLPNTIILTRLSKIKRIVF